MGKEEVFPEPTLSEQDRVATEWQVLFLPNPFVLDLQGSHAHVQHAARGRVFSV